MRGEIAAARWNVYRPAGFEQWGLLVLTENPVRVIVIGTSAGGVQALKTLLGDLHADLDVVLLAVIHLAPSSPGFLPDLFCKRLHCVHPSQGERLQRGRFYLAPPDRHMLIEARGMIRLSHGPKENRARPAIRSAALAFGPDVIGVILTGNLDDGTVGLLAVKRSGVIQDPADAVAPSMPSSAANHVDIDHKVPLSKMAPLLVLLSKDIPNTEQRACATDSESKLK